MSTYWGYHCKNCREDSETWLNRGEEFLSELLRYAPEIIAIKRHLVYVEIGITFADRLWADESPLEWLEKHEGHEICLKNEYGKTTDAYCGA